VKTERQTQCSVIGNSGIKGGGRAAKNRELWEWGKTCKGCNRWPGDETGISGGRRQSSCPGTRSLVMGLGADERQGAEGPDVTLLG
jgi:hypothetical protein